MVMIKFLLRKILSEFRKILPTVLQLLLYFYFKKNLLLSLVFMLRGFGDFLKLQLLR